MKAWEAMKIYWKAVDPDLSAAAQHEAAYALLFHGLAADWNIAHPKVKKTAFGKPILAEENSPYISISHTKGFVCCAVSENPIGIDCEYPRRVSENVMRRVCTQTELQNIQMHAEPHMRFLAYWTLKESISKKLGVGLRESFKNYEIIFQEEKPFCIGHCLRLEKHGKFILACAE